MIRKIINFFSKPHIPTVYKDGYKIEFYLSTIGSGRGGIPLLYKVRRKDKEQNINAFRTYNTNKKRDRLYQK